MTDMHGTAFLAGDHPGAATIAAFVDRRLMGAERERLLAHFAACADCRREMSDVQAALQATVPPARASRGTSWRWLVPLAAAAAVILAVRPSRTAPERTAPSASRVRAANADADADPARLAIVEPAEGDTLGGDRELVWRAEGADATYQVTVQDSAGGPVWNRSLSDTSAAIPGSAQLARGARYYWSVDVRRADGSTGRSSVRTFIAP